MSICGADHNEGGRGEKSDSSEGGAVGVPGQEQVGTARVRTEMEPEVEKVAGVAALTLVEALLIHLEETGRLDGADRDLVFETAIDSHAQAQGADAPIHRAVQDLLTTLHTRADGVAVVGTIARQ